MKFKSVELINACGYRHAKFEFNKNLNMFFGPNGCGKSNMLYMANILASPARYQGRDVSLLFRKMVFHPDYDPGYQAYTGSVIAMAINAVFVDDSGKEYEVKVAIDSDLVRQIDECAKDSTRADEYASLIKKVGVIKNDLPDTKLEYAFLSNADNPSNLSKFQIEQSAAETFLDIAKAVYGYDCTLEKEVEEFDSQRNEYVTFYTDFVIVKKDDGPGFPEVRVHYRRMSDGEKKIATLLKQLCTPLHRDVMDIYLVDNIEMHCYMTRHIPMIQKLLQHFPDKQFLATTHSPVLVGLPDGGIKPYLSQEHLQDVIKIRRNLGRSG